MSQYLKTWYTNTNWVILVFAKSIRFLNMNSYENIPAFKTDRVNSDDNPEGIANLLVIVILILFVVTGFNQWVCF